MTEDDLPGFANPDSKAYEYKDGRKKIKKATGSFQAMGISFPILKGITKRGYKQPTPIQRKSIPLALEDRDVVAMARTGSGKTACFVLPILEKLSSAPVRPLSGKNLRCLILSPTRELALQTLRFVRELGKFTGLKAMAILGGDSLNNQFNMLTTTTPDIIVATPGRFLHVCVEMSLQLNDIKIIVFDEADRLFELGFGQQLQEIIARVPSDRQSLLFSATLPKMLVEFARAGLVDPVLLRLDVEWKLPSGLWLGWIAVRPELRPAALLILLDKVLTPKTPQAVVFVATRHHVEYLSLILEQAGISVTCAYSGLDPGARKLALGRFAAQRCSVLLVTDVAARGLDLPALDTVINYHFPAKPKLFVHRVGRSARAGRSGRAFSLVAADDLAHLLDLQLFLGASLKMPESCSENEKGSETPSGVWGTLPHSLLELRHSNVGEWNERISEITEACRVSHNGWKQYSRCREPASAASNKRAKEIAPPTSIHPFLFENTKEEESRVTADTLISQIKGYRPKGTILELAAKNDSPMYLAMKAKRKKHGDVVKMKREGEDNALKRKMAAGSDSEEEVDTNSQTSLLVTDSTERKRQRKEVIRDENYIPHESSDKATEKGLSVNFSREVKGAEIEMTPDTRDSMYNGKQKMHWDRRRMKMVLGDPTKGNKKMIRTESGNKVEASFMSGRYAKWQKRHRAIQHSDGEDDNEDEPSMPPKILSEFRPQWVKHNERKALQKTLSQEAKVKRTTDQILNERMRKEKLINRKKARGKGNKKLTGKDRKSMGIDKGTVRKDRGSMKRDKGGMRKK